MARRRVPNPRAQRITLVFYMVTVFFLAGFVPTAFLRNPVIAMVVAAAFAIPVGMRSPSPRAGLLRGLGLGALAGLGIAIPLMTALRLPYRLADANGPADPNALALVTGDANAILDANDPNTAGLKLRQMTPGDVRQFYLLAVGGTTLLCAAVAWVFANSAARRRQMIEDRFRDR